MDELWWWKARCSIAQQYNAVVANIIMEKDRKKRVKEKCKGNQGGLLDKKEKTKKSLLLCLTAAGARWSSGEEIRVFVAHLLPALWSGDDYNDDDDDNDDGDNIDKHIMCYCITQ